MSWRHSGLPDLRQEHHRVLPVHFRAPGTGGVEEVDLLQFPALSLHVLFHLLRPLRGVLEWSFEYLREEGPGNPCHVQTGDILRHGNVEVAPPRGVFIGEAEGREFHGLRCFNGFHAPHDHFPEVEGNVEESTDSVFREELFFPRYFLLVPGGRVKARATAGFGG